MEIGTKVKVKKLQGYMDKNQLKRIGQVGEIVKKLYVTELDKDILYVKFKDDETHMFFPHKVEVIDHEEV